MSLGEQPPLEESAYDLYKQVDEQRSASTACSNSSHTLAQKDAMRVSSQHAAASPMDCFGLPLRVLLGVLGCNVPSQAPQVTLYT